MARLVPQIEGEYEFSVEAALDGETTTDSITFQITGYDCSVRDADGGPGDGEEFLASHVSKEVPSGGEGARDVGCIYEANQEVPDSNLPSTRHQGTVVRLPATVDEPACILARIQSNDEAPHDSLEYSDSTTSFDGDEWVPEVLNVGQPLTLANMPSRMSPSGDRFLCVSQSNSDYNIFTWGPGGAVGHSIVVGQPDTTPHFAWTSRPNRTPF